jgi:hypothetical protein
MKFALDASLEIEHPGYTGDVALVPGIDGLPTSHIEADDAAFRRGPASLHLCAHAAGR